MRLLRSLSFARNDREDGFPLPREWQKENSPLNDNVLDLNFAPYPFGQFTFFNFFYYSRINHFLLLLSHQEVIFSLENLDKIKVGSLAIIALHEIASPTFSRQWQCFRPITLRPILSDSLPFSTFKSFLFSSIYIIPNFGRF